MLLNNKLRMLFSMVIALLFTGVIYSQTETAPPSNLKSRVEGSTVKLTWEAPPGATGLSYNIYRAESSGSMSTATDPTKLKFSAIGTITEPSFEDKITATNSEGEYIYYVVAVGSDGKESAGSNYVNVKMDQSKADQHQDKY